MKIILIVSLCFYSLFALQITKGEVEILTYEKKPQSIGYDGKRKLPFIKHPKNGYITIIPIDYKEKAKKATLTQLLHSGTKKIQIRIKEGDYKKETLSVNPAKVSPPKKELDRIYSEYKEATAIYKSITKKRYWDKPFITPMDSKITSRYGNARVYNNTLKGFHGGTDFRAKVGTLVKAVNDGVVVIAKNRYYAGGSIVVDHGYGIYSTYYHLSRLDKKVGQRVYRGEIIGLSGKSGRVTGPHLHFGIMALGYAVNPLDFIQKVNATFKD